MTRSQAMQLLYCLPKSRVSRQTGLSQTKDQSAEVLNHQELLLRHYAI